MAADARWEEIKSIAGRASELTGQERTDFLDAACVKDPSLRGEVERLLAAADHDDSFLVAPALGPHPAAEPTGLVLGEFKLVRELGRGACGVVYLAHQPSLGRDVAVKVMVEGVLTDAVQVERFHREARAAAKLRHPGIVRVLADGRADNTHWFAMEYIAGHDLQREIALQRERKRTGAPKSLLPAPGEDGHITAVARVCAQIASALHHAHEHGVIHRDIKPQNLLLDANAEAHVVDFGLARDQTCAPITGTHDLVGTPHYMSPEQVRAEQVSIDRRTDVYSLGVVLYELCTLRRPFEGRSVAELLTRIERDEPLRPRARNPQLPRALETICLTALAKVSSDRYPDAGAMAADLQRFLRHEPIVARRPRWRVRASRWMRRRRVAIGAAALLVVAPLAVAWFTWNTARAGLSGQLSIVSAVGEDAEVSVRRIDSELGIPSAPIALGALPLDEAELAPGYMRIRVSDASGGCREFTRALEPGVPLRIECPACTSCDTSDMVRIAGGVLSLRDANAPLLVLNNRDVPIEPFLVDRCEVTVAQYARFLAAAPHAPPQGWELMNTAANQDKPVVYVGWRDACAYAEWAGKRLLTFAEWNWIARGAEGRRYPCGVRDPMPGNVAWPFEIELDGMRAYLSKAAVVGSSPDAATPEGVQDLFGNVAEWTETPLSQATDTGFVTRMDVRLIAGHYWNALAFGHSLETFEFEGIESNYASHRVGFRCAASLPMEGP